MKHVLITGVNGFIGRHLALDLSRKGLQVSGIGHGDWTESEQNRWGVNYWLNGDLTQHNLRIVQVSEGQPDVVFHLAGGSSVGPSFSDPEVDFRRSVLSAIELLAWARLSMAQTKLVLASSAAVYGAGHTQAIHETDQISPFSPYGYHKRITEQLFESYGENFGLNVAIVRLFSVYGMELKKQILWDACNKLAKDSTFLKLGGSGNEVRDWLHVSDAVRLLQIAAIHANDKTFIINGGTGVATTVRDIAEHLCASWGKCSKLTFSGITRVGDPTCLVADVSLSALHGFTPQMHWDKGISDYVKWFKQINFQAKT